MLKTRVVILSVAFLVIFILTTGLFAARTDAVSGPSGDPDIVLDNDVNPKFLTSAKNFHLNDGRQPVKLIAPAQNFHLNDGRQPAKVLTLTPAQNFHWNDGRQSPKQ